MLNISVHLYFSSMPYLIVTERPNINSHCYPCKTFWWQSESNTTKTASVSLSPALDVDMSQLLNGIVHSINSCLFTSYRNFYTRVCTNWQQNSTSIQTWLLKVTKSLLNLTASGEEDLKYKWKIMFFNEKTHLSKSENNKRLSKGQANFNKPILRCMHTKD